MVNYKGQLNKSMGPNPLLLTTIIAVSTLITELIVTLILVEIDTRNELRDALTDSFLLTIILTPVFYLFLFRPIQKSNYMRKNLHEEALKNDLLFKSLLDNSPDILAVLDPNGDLIYGSAAVQTTLGYDQGELTGKNVFEYIHPEDLPEVMQAYSEIMGTPNGSVKMDYRFQHKNGSWVYLESSAKNLVDHAYLGSLVVNTRDVTERKHAEQVLAESEERYSNLFKNNHAVMILHDPGTGRIVDANPAACEYYGYSLEAITKLNVSDFNVSSPDDVVQRQKLARDGQQRHFYSKHRLSNGMIRDVEIYSGPIKVQGVQLLYAIIHDITERILAVEMLKRQAQHDFLTGLPNRILLEDRLKVAINNAKRDKTLVALLFLDLDGFKAVNDSLGHNAGDLLLQLVAKRLRDCLRESDTVARIAGDEFTILLSEIKGIEDATIVADKVLKAIERPFKLDLNEVKISTSIGIALYPNHGEDVKQLLISADQAMYKAKTSGKNQYQVC